MKTRLRRLVWLLALLTLGWFGAATAAGAAAPTGPRHQASSDPAPSAVAAPGWATQVSAGRWHTCALTMAGVVQCWGNNDYGQLGDGTTRTRGAPVDVVGLSEGVVMVSAGRLHTCAVTAAGGVKCWGLNTAGQLGDDTTTIRLTPVDVVGLDADIVAVSAGSDHTCALTRAGRVKCWGWNGNGQLGDGTTIMRLIPVEVVDLADSVQMVSAGGYHTCAITAGGGVKCWGENRSGALGDGTWTNRLTPVDVLGLTGGVHAVSSGLNDTCAVLDSGGVKCWGWNWYHPFLSGFPRHTPVEVVELGYDVLAVSAGSYFTCALTVNSGVKCWGRNYHGSVGDGSWQNRDRPVAVVGLATGVRALDAGSSHACALNTAGDVMCWGYNEYSQLGDGSTSDRPAPVEVWRLIYDCAAVSDIPQNECQALITFFKATNGPLWRDHTGWLRTPSPCNWLGVGCAAGRVRQLSLPANRLVDALPAALGELTALQHLDLSGNDLAGPLPAELGQLAALQSLDLSGNALAGPIPAELGALARLRTLNLSNNALSGPLPPQLGALTRLQILDLHANALAGPIPAELGALRELHTLDLSSNQLAGPLPAELGRQRALQTLNLSHNALSGAIPPTLGDLGTLRRLDLSYNALDGPLPWTLSQLTALEHLDLGHNQLTGELPAVWSLLPALRHLDLSYNALSGHLPAEYGQLATLQYLDLGHNALYGPLPAAWGGLHQLQVLSLHSNHLAGPIPAAWVALGSAVTYETPPQPCPRPGRAPPGVWLDLSCNRLSGTLPPELAQIKRLSALSVTANQLRGPLPPGLLGQPELCFDAAYNMLVDDPCPGPQVLPPRGAQATFVPPDTVRLTWVYYPKCPYPVHWPVEISMATAPEGPYTTLGIWSPYPPEYTIPGLRPGARYYFRLRHFAPAEEVTGPSYWGGIFDHAYFQQSNLWSDYVTLTVRLDPVQLWLPLLVQ